MTISARSTRRARVRGPLLAVVVLLSLSSLLAACGTGAATEPPEPPDFSPATGAAGTPEPAVTTGDAAVRSDPEVANAAGAGAGGVTAAAWMTEELRDVRSGETFRIADLSGSLVVIEPMAVWCASCERQQREASKALEALDRPDIVYVSLGVDPTEREEDLAAYADRSGFDWRFAVASRPLARSLAETFGDQVLSPPSTPGILVTPAGEVFGPTFGIRSADELQAEMLEHLS
jgi:hypothetical protein